MSSNTPKSSVRSLLTPRNIVAAILVALAFIFILQNRSATTIQLFWVSVQAPLWLTFAVILVIGWIAGMLTGRRK